MFKISIVDAPPQRTLVVEGKLIEPWVSELRPAWKSASRHLDGSKLVIDVGSLTVISREGEDAIFDLMKKEQSFPAAAFFNRHFLKRLARKCHGKGQDAMNPTQSRY